MIDWKVGIRASDVILGLVPTKTTRHLGRHLGLVHRQIRYLNLDLEGILTPWERDHW